MSAVPVLRTQALPALVNNEVREVYIPQEVLLSPRVPRLWPVDHPERTIISWFGVRGRRVHSGIDIKCPLGTEVTATASGEVTLSGVMRGYGNIVVIDHGEGFETRYGHLQSRAVETGQTVTAGACVGCLGQTGNASTYHLHYEVRYRAEALDPNFFLPAE